MANNREENAGSFLEDVYKHPEKYKSPDALYNLASEAAKTILAQAEQAGMQNDLYVLNSVKIILADPEDALHNVQLFEDVMKYLQPHIAAMQLDSNPFKPYPREEVFGPAILGTSYQGITSSTIYPVGLTAEELTQHILIVGRTGAGKTNLIFFLLQSLIGNIPFWIFDFKRDYRNLLYASQNTLVFNWRDFKFNPLRPPPGVDPSEWLQTFTNTFCEALGLLYGSKSFLRSIVHNLYTQRGVYSGSDDYPSIIDLKQALDGIDLNYWKNRVRSDYLQRCHGRVGDCVTVLGDVFDCEHGFPMDELLGANIIFELDGLNDSELQNLIITLLLSYVFVYRIANNHRGQLRHVIIFDEAKRIFDINKERNPVEGIPTIAMLTSQIREFGEGLVVSDQMIKMLGESIKSNVGTKICMSLSDGGDVMEMASSMGMSPEQAQYLNQIGVGESVIRISGRYPMPFVMLTPEVPLKSSGHVTDEEVKAHMKPFLEKLKSRESKKSAPVVEETRYEKTPQQPAKKTEKVVRISEDGKRFLIHVRDIPFIPYTERLTDLNLSGSKGGKVQEELLDNDLIGEVKIKISKRGPKSKFFQITTKGEALVGKQNLGPGKGGFEHVFYQHLIKQHYEANGSEAEIEMYLKGKNADVGVKTKGGFEAVEVAISPEREIDNIEADLKAGFTRVTIVCKDKTVQSSVENAVRKQFSEKNRGNISITLISEYLQ